MALIDNVIRLYTGDERVDHKLKREHIIILALFLLGIIIIRSFYLDQNKIEYNNYTGGSKN